MNKKCPNCAKEIEEWRDICPNCLCELEDCVTVDKMKDDETHKKSECAIPVYTVPQYSQKKKSISNEYVYLEKTCGITATISAVLFIIFSICKVTVSKSVIDANMFGIFAWISSAVFFVSFICAIINAQLIKIDKRITELEKENEELRNPNNKHDR